MGFVVHRTTLKQYRFIVIRQYRAEGARLSATLSVGETATAPPGIALQRSALQAGRAVKTVEKRPYRDGC